MAKWHLDLSNEIAAKYQFEPGSDELSTFLLGCGSMTMAVAGFISEDEAEQALTDLGLAEMPEVLEALKEFASRAEAISAAASG